MGFHDPNFAGSTDRINNPDALYVPTPQEIGALVHTWRRLLNWKQETLAQFATVSLSTIERIERGEMVSAESLDRVAMALWFKEGDFRRPRRLHSFEEALAHVVNPDESHCFPDFADYPMIIESYNRFRGREKLQGVFWLCVFRIMAGGWLWVRSTVVKSPRTRADCCCGRWGSG